MPSFRLTVQRKVFLAVLALTTATVAIIFASTQWNLSQGFGRYLAETELQRFEGLVGRLSADYRGAGSWKFVTEDAGYWHRLLEEHRRPEHDRHFDRPDGPPPENAFRERRPPPGAGHFPLDKRLGIVDAQGKRVTGGGEGSRPVVQRPVVVDGRIVGQLVLEVPRMPVGDQAVAFLVRQSSALWLACAVALLLACVAAWWLARHFLAPIRHLSAAARQISGGQYTIRIPVQQGDELGDLAEDFNRMAETLAHTEESRRQWISDTSHELRTPLAVLRAEIEALQDGVRSPGDASYARLHQQIMQLGKLVDDLRYTLDSSGDGPPLDCRQVAPLAILRETAEQFRARFAAARLVLDCAALADDGPQLWGDADRLRQVFVNLLENSLRYTRSGGRVQLTAGVAAGGLWIQFDDTAPAPPATALPHIFERFFRAEASRSRTHGGAGLGLSISKALVEAHGGQISAALSPLGGLTVRILLPLDK
ncbi:MAG: HAMP domain-containing protein [Sulfuricella sp.]|nr:HAMP domain-containing protein [Sulfuricella sp.]